MADDSKPMWRKLADLMRDMPQPEMGWEKFPQIVGHIVARSTAPPHYSKAFLSYLREDEPIVERLATEIRKQGITVFRDRDSLNPGQPWEAALKQAILQGTYFIACFSTNYLQRPSNYMRQELAVALEEIRQGNKGEGWFVPVLLNDVDIKQLPEFETLNKFHCLALFGDWNVALHRLFRVVRPPCSMDPQIEVALRDVCSSHLESKIARFGSEGHLRIPELEARWRSLLHPIAWTATAELVVQLFTRAKEAALPQTDQFLDKSEYNRLVAVTVATSLDAKVVLRHLDVAEKDNKGCQSWLKLRPFARQKPAVTKECPDHPYARFVARRRTELRKLPQWTSRDFVHWVFCEDDREIQVDLLYCPAFAV